MSRGGSAIGTRPSATGGEHTGNLLRELVRSGKSFSGREPNCCYLNLGQPRWANVSAISGFDAPDDGRAIAISDADLDGDLDLWVVNRSGPQLRYFQNDLNRQPRNDFITFRLSSSLGNRDAIGARVELTLTNPSMTLLRTLRAGDGYLSQSSKVIHFGIPANSAIDKAVIRWPNGAVQPIASLHKGRHYAIEQGQTAREWSPPNDTRDATATAQKHATSIAATTPPSHHTASARLFLTTPLPVPDLGYRSFSGQSQSIRSEGRHCLVNLWSTSCMPCISELTEWTQQRQRIERAQIDVVALCVDHLTSETAEPSADRSDPHEFLSKLNFPFRSGLAENELVDLLQLLNNHLVDLHLALPVPSSFLFDSQGRLSAIYRGPVSVDDLLGDVALSEATAERRRANALTFEGRWSGDPRTPRLLTLALSMLDAGLVDETLRFLEKERRALAADPEFAILLFNIGQQLTIRDQHEQAISFYQQALEHDPRLSSAHYNLAISYLQAGQEDAARRHLEKTIEIEPKSSDALLYLGQLLAKRGELVPARTLLLQAVDLRPEHAETHFQLAVVTLLTGGLDEGLRHYQLALEREREKYSQPERRADLVAAMKLTLRTLEAKKTPSATVVAKWRNAIERLQ